jgi:prevent-host-death family protein
MAEPHTLSATEFKATCLEVMDRVARGEWERVAITKRGKVVAVLVPPSAAEAGAAPLHGFLRGSVPGRGRGGPDGAEPEPYLIMTCQIARLN